MENVAGDSGCGGANDNISTLIMASRYVLNNGKGGDHDDSQSSTLSFDAMPDAARLRPPPPLPTAVVNHPLQLTPPSYRSPHTCIDHHHEGQHQKETRDTRATGKFVHRRPLQHLIPSALASSPSPPPSPTTTWPSHRTNRDTLAANGGAAPTVFVANSLRHPPAANHIRGGSLPPIETGVGAFTAGMNQSPPSIDEATISSSQRLQKGPAVIPLPYHCYLSYCHHRCDSRGRNVEPLVEPTAMPCHRAAKGSHSAAACKITAIVVSGVPETDRFDLKEGGEDDREAFGGKRDGRSKDGTSLTPSPSPKRTAASSCCSSHYTGGRCCASSASGGSTFDDGGGGSGGSSSCASRFRDLFPEEIEERRQMAAAQQLWWESKKKKEEGDEADNDCRGNAEADTRGKHTSSSSFAGLVEEESHPKEVIEREEEEEDDNVDERVERMRDGERDRAKSSSAIPTFPTNEVIEREDIDDNEDDAEYEGNENACVGEPGKTDFDEVLRPPFSPTPTSQHPHHPLPIPSASPPSVAVSNPTRPPLLMLSPQTAMLVESTSIPTPSSSSSSSVKMMTMVRGGGCVGCVENCSREHPLISYCLQHGDDKRCHEGCVRLPVDKAAAAAARVPPVVDVDDCVVIGHHQLTAAVRDDHHAPSSLLSVGSSAVSYYYDRFDGDGDEGGDGNGHDSHLETSSHPAVTVAVVETIASSCQNVASAICDDITAVSKKKDNCCKHSSSSALLPFSSTPTSTSVATPSASSSSAVSTPHVNTLQSIRKYVAKAKAKKATSAVATAAATLARSGVLTVVAGPLVGGGVEKDNDDGTRCCSQLVVARSSSCPPSSLCSSLCSSVPAAAPPLRLSPLPSMPPSSHASSAAPSPQPDPPLSFVVEMERGGGGRGMGDFFFSAGDFAGHVVICHGAEEIETDDKDDADEAVVDDRNAALHTSPKEVAVRLGDEFHRPSRRAESLLDSSSSSSSSFLESSAEFMPAACQPVPTLPSSSHLLLVHNNAKHAEEERKEKTHDEANEAAPQLWRAASSNTSSSSSSSSSSAFLPPPYASTSSTAVYASLIEGGGGGGGSLVVGSVVGNDDTMSDLYRYSQDQYQQCSDFTGPSSQHSSSSPSALPRRSFAVSLVPATTTTTNTIPFTPLNHVSRAPLPYCLHSEATTVVTFPFDPHHADDGGDSDSDNDTTIIQISSAEKNATKSCQEEEEALLDRTVYQQAFSGG